MMNIFQYRDTVMMEQFVPLLLLLIPFVLLDLVLRALALWRAARTDRVGWFVALLLVNSLGILPGIFLLMTRGSRGTKKKAATKRKGEKTL